jgi:hypothetical protein
MGNDFFVVLSTASVSASYNGMDDQLNLKEPLRASTTTTHTVMLHCHIRSRSRSRHAGQVRHAAASTGKECGGLDGTVLIGRRIVSVRFPHVIDEYGLDALLCAVGDDDWHCQLDSRELDRWEISKCRRHTIPWGH